MRTTRTQLLVDLRVSQDKANPLLTEYLKARYYYYSVEAGVRLRPGEGDYGPVDESLLRGFSGGKGPVSFKQSYEAYRRIPNVVN